MQALELNDALLIVAATQVAVDGDAVADSDAVRILASAPGAACVTDNAIMVGTAAAAQARLQPQRVHQRFWRDLSAEPLGRAPRPQLSAADLAFEQLCSLRSEAEAAGGADATWLIAVPPMFSREQLGLLLGIAGEAGAGEIGLVDAALAACALDNVPDHVLHLELYRHCAIVTAVEQTPTGARRARFEIDEQCGTQRLEQLCLDTAAAQFVRQTRFDPLHQARTEQLLADEMPRMLSTLLTTAVASVAISTGSESLQVDMARGQWLATAESSYAALLQLVQRARPAGQAVELRVGARAQSYPGLVERLQTLKTCRVALLSEGAAARGALLHASAILRGAEPALICQLPLAHAAPDEAALLSEPAAIAVRATATHLLHAGRAWPLQADPLNIGTQLPAGSRALQLPAGTPGISRIHCCIRVQDGVALVEDQSTYGSYINDERIHGRAALQRGDRLRLGTPGLILDAIEVLRE
jgi:hypothetical protein